MGAYNIHAGHNPDGKTACGAIGLIKESTENRNVCGEVIKLLKQEGHQAFDCTVNNGSSKSDVVNKIVNLTKRNKADLDVSIHFNSGAKDQKGNGNTTGVEVLVYKNEGLAGQKAKAVCDSVAKLGFKNRGVKVRTDLGVLRNTLAPAILVECCFVDDYDDCKAYNYKVMAKAIVEGILGKSIGATAPSLPNNDHQYKNGDYDRKAKVVNVGSTGLNVRKERGKTNDIPVRSLKEGTILKVSYCLNNWFSTYDYKYNNQPTYICGEYIELL
ncbi:N-acetylmuramoyl-L-alanine amidase [Romboutsia sp.]|uniref:N-acetylmuramoyl-L-alanine amidase n=1 Tax=Romboutsia sp. TaxID=1965302 RepID=UPI003F31D1F3